jgi:aminopeptidase N
MTTLSSLNTTGMASTVLVEAQNSTRVYNSFFGKLPYKRMAMSQQPAGFFGQAWGTLVFMPYIAFIGSTHRVQLLGMQGGTNGFWREVAPHEVAHQWWGHMVGWTSYRDQWMSEGFSEFSTSIYIQYVKNDTNKFIEFWEEQRKLITEASPQTKGRKPYTVGPLTQGYRLNSAKTGNIARAMIYPKGAFVLHMLRMMMFDRDKRTGDAKFKAMMQDFLASHYNKDVSTNDFKKIVEKHMLPAMDVDKNRSMDWFFDQWIYGTEMPSYELTYQIGTGENGKPTLSGKITQSGVSDKFVMLVPVYLDFGKGWVYLGSARMAGNTTVELNNISLPEKPKKVAVAALQDVLAEKIVNKKQ